MQNTHVFSWLLLPTTEGAPMQLPACCCWRRGFLGMFGAVRAFEVPRFRGLRPGSLPHSSVTRSLDSSAGSETAEETQGGAP